MASGSYTKKSEYRFSAQTRSTIPARATRLFSDEVIEDLPIDGDIGILRISTNWQPFQSMRRLEPGRLIVIAVCMSLCVIVLSSLVLSQRPTSPAFVSYVGGQVYTMQVGGDRAATWQQSRATTCREGATCFQRLVLGFEHADYQCGFY